MPFIPHTDDDIGKMLAQIGARSVEDLFDEIPDDLRIKSMDRVPEAVSEMEIARLMQDRARMDSGALNFIGGGAYEHHVPAAVWEITTRGEFYTAYTPYQAESSQGTLQLINENKTMMTGLTGMEVSNASLYDGASALAEACLMAVRANRASKSRRILVAGAMHPVYRKVADVICAAQEIEFIDLPFCSEGGHSALQSLDKYSGEDLTAVIVQQPNFFGVLEDVDAISDWAQAQKALTIAVVNPTSLALLTPPGEWGEQGADIVCGEGQPLGIPLSSGGPYFGFLTTRLALVRQMPGRLVGRTVDLDGKRGFTLTLQAREQHIRRSKATSNICTNQGLMVTAATIYMSLLGAEGLARVAGTAHQKTSELCSALCELPGVERVFDRPFFHEVVIRLDRPVGPVLDTLADQGILGGLELTASHPELGNALLLCATETKSDADIGRYRDSLAEIMSRECAA
ncbi:MAG: aminomethyl-transferring glycine dehydrogenase subunit GcvPA [Gammaproteobacteria bacterium]|nr:aminomethyl-transferring glycine dehydrogenase subunit GcvPA [Gammaproteobacteria bacterium]